MKGAESAPFFMYNLVIFGLDKRMEKSNLQIASDEITEELIRIKQNNFDAIEEFTAEQIVELLDENLISTDVIIESYTLVNQMTFADSVNYKALSKLAQTVELVQHWIKTHVIDGEDLDLSILESDDDL